MNQEALSFILVLASTIFVGLLLGGLIYFFNLQAHVKDLLEWIDTKGIWAPILFIILDVVVVVFLFPGVLITMGAGFLFGVVMGSIYIIVATTIGAIMAFMLARYLLTGSVKKYIRSKPRLNLLDKSLASEGWRLVLATRLIPFFPFKLSNYIFGLTKFRLKDFFIGTFFGIWPITIFNVYVGSITADLSTLGTETEKTNLEWTFYIFGFVSTIFAVVYIGHRAKQALKKYIPDSEKQISANT
jgi:uncharacterized membrane protein YdjX (TVP38/TMEM64 family)